MKYDISLLAADTYRVTDPGLADTPANLFVLFGSEKVLLIDSGYGWGDLHEVLRQIIRSRKNRSDRTKQVFCALTHGHDDHIQGAAQFDRFYISRADAALYAENADLTAIRDADPDTYARCVTPQMAAFYEVSHRDKHPLFLDEIPVFELGGRAVEVEHFPGHTAGSVVFFDRNTRLVFEGDIAPKSAWFFYRALPLTQYGQNLCAYREWLKTRGCAGRYEGHQQTAQPVSGIDENIACLQQLQALRKAADKPASRFEELQVQGKRIIFRNW